jgi:two-component system alkaline phosphatase synthesis response regulator PhoP
MKGTILLIEDDPSLQASLALRLRSNGYAVEAASDGTEGLEKATGSPVDLIMLDAVLPDRDGFDVCRDMRQAGLATPIMLLTARKRTIDKVVGLKMGADDYVTKPFKAEELLARIEVLLRRVPAGYGFGVHQFGPIRVDLRRAQVTRDNTSVHLSAREFQLLRHFIESAGVTIPRGDLLQSIWGYSEQSLTRTVDMHVSSLRDKLEQNPRSPELIVTVSGVGYKFVGSKNS